MNDKIKKINELAESLADLSDNVIVLASTDLGQINDKDGNQAMIHSKGNTLKLAVLIKHYLEINKSVASCMKILDLIPNAYSTEEVKNDKGEN